MLGWARSVTTSWAGPRMASTNQKARKMIDRWEVGVLGFLRPSITTNMLQCVRLVGYLGSVELMYLSQNIQRRIV